MNKTTLMTCDDCGKEMLVITRAIGVNCVIAVCNTCAKAPISVHDQVKMDDEFRSPPESMVIGTLTGNSITTTRCKKCGAPVPKLHMYCFECAPNF